ncbi:hypothetical protein FRC11_014928, partial [Ceratobasidium sp. 423]
LMEAMARGELILDPTESALSQTYGDRKAVPMIIKHLITQLKDGATSWTRPKIFAGTIADKWQPKYIDAEVEPLDHHLHIMWPYGAYGADWSLGGKWREAMVTAIVDEAKAIQVPSHSLTTKALL